MGGHRQSDPVLRSLLRVAGEPARWEELLDVLHPGDPPSGAQLTARLDAVAGLATLARAGGEGDETVGPAPAFGVLLVAVDGFVLACNTLASEVMDDLASADVGARLRFREPANADAVRNAIDMTRRTGQRVGFRLETRDGEAPRFAYAIPASAIASADSRGADLGVLLVFASSPSEGETWSTLRRSFGLSEAETRLARRLSDGASLQDAAAELDLSVHTVRNQLRSVFDKMGLHRQGDLLRAVHDFELMTGALPPVRPDPPHPGPPVQRMRLPDGRILAYREYGDPAGEAVLWFHEGLGSSLLLPDTDPSARDLGVRIVAPERPGFGASDPMPGSYRFETVADDMVHLLAHLGIERLRIGAVLSGAPAALFTAARLGGRVDLVLLCSGRPPGQTRLDAASSFHARMRAGLERQPWVIDALCTIIRLRRSTDLTRRMVTRSIGRSPGDAAYLNAHPEVIDYVSTYVGESLRHTGRGVADEMKAFHRTANSPRPYSPAPVEIWHGAQDGFARLEPLLDYVGPAHTLRLFDDAGHLLAVRYWRELMQRLAAGPVQNVA